MSRLNAAQTRECFGDIARLVRDLDRAHRDLLHRDRDDPGPGYPPSSLGGGGGGTADPVGELVATLVELDDRADGVQHAVREIERAALAARRLLDAAWSAAARTRAAAPASRTDDVWCTSCLRAHVVTPRGAEKEVGADSTLCRWCHDWQREHRALPPVALIERRARGERITSRVIDEALGGVRRHDRRRNRARR